VRFLGRLALVLAAVLAIVIATVGIWWGVHAIYRSQAVAELEASGFDVRVETVSDIFGFPVTVCWATFPSRDFNDREFDLSVDSLRRVGVSDYRITCSRSVVGEQRKQQLFTLSKGRIGGSVTIHQ
jgi:hypothetical protein